MTGQSVITLDTAEISGKPVCSPEGSPDLLSPPIEINTNTIRNMWLWEGFSPFNLFPLIFIQAVSHLKSNFPTSDTA